LYILFFKSFISYGTLYQLLSLLFINKKEGNGKKAKWLTQETIIYLLSI